MATRIGVLADTHLPGEIRQLWAEVGVAFAGCDVIVHAGDIVLPSVLDELEAWAPVVLAAEGNNDFGLAARDPRVRPVQWFDVEGWRVAVVHDMEPEDQPIEVLEQRYLGGAHADVLLTGHTHFERIDHRHGVLQVNPGSPTHPHLWSTRLGTVAVLDLAPGHLEARIVVLGETEGRRNPGAPLRFDGRVVHPVA